MRNLKDHLVCIQQNQLDMIHLFKQLVAQGGHVSLSVVQPVPANSISKHTPQSFVYVPVIMNMTGLSEGTGQRWLRNARKFFGLPPHTPVTVEQLAVFKSIPVHVIYRHMP
jgi:hypothetical protein